MSDTKQTKGINVHKMLNDLFKNQKLQACIELYSSICDKYSLNNALRAMAQNPNVTNVAGKKQWREKGRDVLPDAKPIILYAPKFSFKDTEEGTKIRVLEGWNEVEVYDITQTTACAEPGIKFNMGLDADFLFRSYSRKISEKGISINILSDDEMDKKFGYSVKGFADYDENAIYIRKGNSIQMIKTLFHEWAHLLIHKNNKYISKEEKEIEAELCSVIACKHLDLEVENISLPYLAAWINEATKLQYSIKRISWFAAEFCKL